MTEKRRKRNKVEERISHLGNLPQDKFYDPRILRGIVLHILDQYQRPEDPKAEHEIEETLPLLQLERFGLPVREQAARITKIWLGLKGRDPLKHRRLIFYRLRHLDNELSELERMTRPKKAQ
jgi:hypothetical protein